MSAAIQPRPLWSGQGQLHILYVLPKNRPVSIRLHEATISRTDLFLFLQNRKIFLALILMLLLLLLLL